MVFQCSPPSQFWEAEFSQKGGGKGTVEIEENNETLAIKKDKIRIFILLPGVNKNILTVVCEPNLPVKTLKEKIVEVAGCELNQVRLVKDGRRMGEGRLPLYYVT